MASLSGRRWERKPDRRNADPPPQTFPRRVRWCAREENTRGPNTERSATWNMNDIDLLSRLGVALSIGLLVGLERGWQTRDETSHRRAAGLRTFALSGLLGGVCGAIAAATTAPLLIGFAFLGYTAAFTAFHWLEARATGNLSVTTLVSGLLTFLLGAFVIEGSVSAAVAAAVAMTLLLALRDPLHRWVGMLSWIEIRAVLTLLAMTFLLLPVLPDQPIDPWNTINPSRIWMIAIFVAMLSFGGYVAVRAFGDRIGVLVAAVAGGMASSTATTVTLARLGRERPQAAFLLSAGILASGTVMIVRVGILATVLYQPLALALMPTLTAMGLVLASCSTLLFVRTGTTANPTLSLTNPLQLASAIKMAAFIAMVMTASVLLRRFFGDTGLLSLAAVSGLADVDAITVSMAELARNSEARDTAALAITLAVCVNTAVKALLAAWFGRRPVGIPVLAATVLTICAGALAFIAL
ncbi:MgtC/SapB family protein [Aurantimonas sp. A2-1-M11]|uniref:MgtC/SapB family protein n=1 Tax=Aurantimonas sp. A2-1-M11 TaxID=3113712 RepID=UPI002F950F93